MSPRCEACTALLGPGTPWDLLRESRCGSCGRALTVARLDEEAERALAQVTPPRLTVEESPAFVVISIPGFHRSHLGSLALTAAWWLLVALNWRSTPFVPPLENPSLLGMAGLGVAAAGVLLARLVDTTRVAVGRTTLEVRHGPLPLRRAVALPTGSLRQLYVLVRPAQGGSREAPSQTYSLMVQRFGAEPVELVRGLPLLSEARFLERKLEAFLGLAHAPVDGEADP
jgi:hypothetical protein